MPRIEPIKGSSSVFGDSRARDRVKAHVLSHTTTHSLETNEEINGGQDLGQYTGERWWDSVQNWRPIYDRSLRQYDIRKPDGTLWTQADADKICKEFPLSYPDDYKNPSDRGKPIEKANIKSYGDAYFEHPSLNFMGKEGVLDIPDGDWGDFVLSIATGNPGVKPDDGKDFRSGDTRYRVNNPAMEAQREEAIIDMSLDAAELFAKMDFDGGDLEKMTNILVLFGVDISVEAGRSKIRKTLHPYVNDKVTTDSGRTRQSLFIEYAKLPPDVLEAMAIVKRSVHRGHISQRAGSYFYKETFTGGSFQEVVNYFRDIKNSQAMENLKADLKNDKS